MSQKISQMTVASALTGEEVVPVLQGGVNRRTTTQAIADLGGGGGGGALVYVASLISEEQRNLGETSIEGATINQYELDSEDFSDGVSCHYVSTSGGSPGQLVFDQAGLYKVTVIGVVIGRTEFGFERWPNSQHVLYGLTGAGDVELLSPSQFNRTAYTESDAGSLFNNARLVCDGVMTVNAAGGSYLELGCFANVYTLAGIEFLSPSLHLTVERLGDPI